MPHDIAQHSIKNEIKSSVSLTLPLIASQLIYASSGFLGTAMIAHLGKNALAASVLVSMVWFSLSVLFFGILNAVSILVSHQHGAKNNTAISEIMGQSYLLGIVVCALMFLVLSSVPYFLRWSMQPPEVLQIAHAYMHALLWTLPSLVVLIISEQFLAGLGRTKLVLRISMLIVPLEIPLIYILIFGKFGLPKCGVAGVGYGFAISYTMTAIFLVLYLVRSKQYQHYKIFTGFNKIHLGYLKELILVGLPMGFMHVIEVSTFAVATFWIGRFGTELLAAHQIVMQYLGFAITIVFAMSQAVTIRVGHAVGRQDLRGVQYAIYVGMILNFCCMAIIAFALYISPKTFLMLDMNVNDVANTALVKKASLLLSISAVLMLFDNFRIIGFGALRGLKDTQFPMYASLINFWLVGLFFAHLFGFTFHMQGKGIWWGLTLGIASGALMVFVRLQYILRRVDLAKLVTTH